MLWKRIRQRLWGTPSRVSHPVILLRYRNPKSRRELSVELHITDLRDAPEEVFVHHFTEVAREFAKFVIREEG